MAMLARSNVLPMFPDDEDEPDPLTGASETQLEDGSVVYSFDINDAANDDDEAEGEDFYRNLVDDLSDSDLAWLATEILEGVDADIQSRRQWMSDRERGIDLLGIKVSAPRTGSVDGTATSTVTHPLLLDACINFRDNTTAELLPAAGPCKIKNTGRGTRENDARATKLEQSFNTALMSKMPEYYAGTDKMIWEAGFSGMGFKKVYHCPVRRRPTSERVDPSDLIVSNDADDMRSAGRVTHRIKMRQAMMARMQYVGAYREVELHAPSEDTTTLERKVATVQGVRTSTQRPEDIEYTLYETYVDLDMPGFEHKEKGKTTGLPMPYKITVEIQTRVVLEVRRNWREEDQELFAARRRFVAFPFEPMFGFYASGLLHILANTTTALTGAWRMFLDATMFGNFPGFLYAKQGDRQLDNNFRVAPGEGAPIDVAAGTKLSDAVMPLPYKEVGPASQAFVKDIADTGQRVGGTPNTPFAEGSSTAPVGTTLANLEQVMRMLSAVHRRMYSAQAEELEILQELFREDPEALYKLLDDDNDWADQSELAAALMDLKLIPVANPNTPTQMHRIMKMMGLKQMADGAPDRYDLNEVDKEVLTAMGFDDVERFFTPPQPQAMPQDPSLAIATVVAKTEAMKAQTKAVSDKEANQVKVMDIEAKRAIAQERAQVDLAKIKSELEDAQIGREQDAQLEVLDHQVTLQAEAMKDRTQRADMERQTDVDRMKDATVRKGHTVKAKQAKQPAKKAK